MKKYIPIVLILLVTCVFRFAFLDKIPNAISGDELLYDLTAKSVYLSKHDMSGTWNPLSAFIFRYPPGEQQAELPYFLHLLFSAFPFTIFVSKLPFALLSVGIVLMLYLITRELFGENAAIATGLIAAINPWLVVMGRTGYESTSATFFYLAGLYLLFKLRSWKIFWSLIPFIFAFYSYIATKTVFIPFIALGALVSFYLHKKHYGRHYIALFLLCTFVVIAFVLLLHSTPAGSRIAELNLPNSPEVASQVDSLRKASLQIGMLPIFVNKFTVYSQTLLIKFFRILSPSYLFIEGDQFFLPVRQSFFYYIDFIFIALGTMFLFAKKRLLTITLWVFILIGAVPHLLNKTGGDFSGHLALMFPFIVILIGIGVAETVQAVSKRIRTVVFASILLIYVFNVANFAFVYFYQYPLVGSSDFPMRILSKYLDLTSQTKIPVTVYSNRSGDLFKNFLFYSNGINRDTLPIISRINTRLPFVYDNIHFTDCDEGVKTINPSIITVYDTTCMMHIDGSRVYIATLLDSGRVYGIYNDRICSKYSLKTYPSGIRISDFGVEQLSEKSFCETFVVR